VANWQLLAAAFEGSGGTLSDTGSATKQTPAPKFDIANIDKAADPCVDFYQYACGNLIFLGFARGWCENITPELLRESVQTDPHSPGRWRVNGVVQNMPEFQRVLWLQTGPGYGQSECMQGVVMRSVTQILRAQSMCCHGMW
jgi:predicted metalloendopeptidase